MEELRKMLLGEHAVDKGGKEEIKTGKPRLKISRVKKTADGRIFWDLNFFFQYFFFISPPFTL